MTSWCGSPAHHQDAVAGRWNSGSCMVINVCLVERNWHHSSLQLRRQREPQRVAQMTRKKKQKKLGNDKICKWLMSCKTMNQVRIRFWYLIGLAGFGVTNRKCVAFACYTMISYTCNGTKWNNFIALHFLSLENSHL